MPGYEQINGLSQQRIAIVGAGGAGMAAAWSLSRYPHRYKVDVYDIASKPGGVASTQQFTTVHKGDTVEFELNDGVQGGANTYHNTILLHQQTLQDKHKTDNIDINSDIVQDTTLHQNVEMTVSFGLKSQQTNWTNYLPQNTNGTVITKCSNDIKRFKLLLYLIKYMEFIFICMPTYLVLSLFRFSNEFQYYMIYPLTALFFGTGNQTPYISSALLSRVFLDSELKLFDYDSERLLSSKPNMFAFSRLTQIYTDLQHITEKQSHNNVRFLFTTQIQHISRHDKTIHITAITSANKQIERTYDHIILTCNTTAIIKMLGSDNLTFAENVVLNNVQWYTDITYTHTDSKYIEQFYTVNNNHSTDNYYIYSDINDANRLEMSFNLTNYQPSMQALKQKLGPDFNIYQTIYLNKHQQRYWNINYLDKSKVLGKKVWYQMSHTWRHFMFTVPLVRFINQYQSSGGSTLYAGSWTMFNTHEIAIISGLVSAHRLGATYPFGNNELANKQFDLYINMIHGKDQHDKTPMLQMLLNMILLPFLLIGHILINVLRIL